MKTCYQSSETVIFCSIDVFVTFSSYNTTYQLSVTFLFGHKSIILTGSMSEKVSQKSPAVIFCVLQCVKGLMRLIFAILMILMILGIFELG